jgi:hypothetical protein
MTKRYTKLSNDFGSDLLGYYSFLDQALDLIPHDNYECYYVSNGETEGFTSIKTLGEIPYQRDLVIWLCSDHLRGVNEYKFYNGDTKPHGLLDLETICRQHPAKNFVLLTPHCNMQPLVEVANLKVVNIPPFNWMIDKTKNTYTHGYLTKQAQQHQWAAFVNYPLWHRVSLCSYLLFLNLDTTGFLSMSSNTDALAKRYTRIDEFLAYRMSKFEWHCFNQGFQKLRNNSFMRGTIPAYESIPPGENILNYNQILLPIYNRVRVELVPGSIFSESTPYITEKELQAIYGSNFMILFDSPGTVETLRQWGFDMFDDVVNHSYDQEADPVQRMIRAISDNIHLLNGTDDVNIVWEKNRHRFEKNCIHADTVIEQLINRSLDNFKLAIQ